MRIVSSLKTKIILSVAVILSVTIGAGTWINIRYQQRQMEDALQDSSLVISNTIERSLANVMLQGRSREVQSIIDAVGGYHNITQIRIFTPTGVVLKSSVRGTIGRGVDPVLQQWYQEGIFRKPIKRSREGVFTVLFPIDNTPQCYPCHGIKETLNGILAVDVSLLPTREKVNELTKNMVLWAAVVTGVLAVSLSVFLTRFVTKPIHDLILTMERAERGLEVRATVKGTDDLGRLGMAFNSLLSKLERARRKVERYHYEQMKRADRLASIGEMAAGIAHEIKNPLAGIAGVIQVMQSELPPGDQKHAVLDEVIVQVERMDKAVRNLLAFARPPEPKMTFADINDLIEKLFDFLSPQFTKYHITTERKLMPGIPRLSLDPDLIQQAFLNIALNAIQAMPEGGTFTVETKAGPAGNGRPGTVSIVFSDSGKGIPLEDLGRIFSPFFTTRQQGTGLGLSITRRIVEQHNGEISVSSNPGTGTVFTIVFPRLEPSGG